MRENEQIIYFLSPSIQHQVEGTGSLIRQSLALRTEDL